MAAVPDSGHLSNQSKSKTKAKNRYLRRKKERRKLRAKQQTSSNNINATVGDDDSESEASDERSDLDHNNAETRTLSPPSKVDPLPQRPSKRQKTLSNIKEDAISSRVVQGDDDADVKMDQDTPLQPTKPRSPTPPPLPIFPLPALPNAPSKSTLALQGLDKALIDALVVDPDVVLPIPADGPNDGGTRLSEKMRRRLHDSGITELFAVQTSLLPFLIPSSNLQRQLYTPSQPPRDVCVSAPTGSGKSLSYILPIIEILSSRIVTQLRALIVLPTRDLVAQVHETFEVLGKGRGLKIGTATGQHSFAHEQARLVSDQTSSLLGGSSKVDVLICTPGRLMDHLNGTLNFTLQHLRFLVIDEADRLLAQSFQDWLAQVLAATRSPTIHGNTQTTRTNRYPHFDAVAPNVVQRLPFPHLPTFPTEAHESSCQKMLFSATLTRDPGKIAALDLREPKYFVVQRSKDLDEQNHVLNIMEKFSMPSTLQEHMIICESSQKPLMFFHLVFGQSVSDALVFTKSAESTARLVKLFDFFQRWRQSRSEDPPLIVRAYSSDLPMSERKAILEQFKAQEINILICSDLISRGIDISHVSHVVSYDVPVDMLKYVHRVGRTARAGRVGCAWTLVEEQEARYFKHMLKEADHLDRIKRLRVSEKDLSALTPGYEVALKQLKDVYTRS